MQLTVVIIAFFLSSFSMALVAALNSTPIFLVVAGFVSFIVPLMTLPFRKINKFWVCDLVLVAMCGGVSMLAGLLTILLCDITSVIHTFEGCAPRRPLAVTGGALLVILPLALLLWFIGLRGMINARRRVSQI